MTRDDGKRRCVHSFDNGACELPTEFMCPYYLRWEADNPDAHGLPVPYEVLVRVRERRPPKILEKF